MSLNYLTLDNRMLNWLNVYAEEAGMKGFVVGVSGGIDSAVVSTMCAKTGKPVYALTMPIYQNRKEVNLSARHIKWLTEKYKNVIHYEVPLSESFESILTTMVRNNISYGSPAYPSDVRKLTESNTRSRLRMVVMYFYAGIHNSLVVGTGNKIEDFGVGFYTKYGDGGVDLSPIANLTKTEVRGLGEHLDIIEDIIKAAPTDGLWEDGRTDEDQLGATYEELEWAMDFVEKEIEPGVDELSERQKFVLEIYKILHKKNKHKMEPIPVFDTSFLRL